MPDVYLTDDDGRFVTQDDGSLIVAYSYQVAAPAPPTFTAADFITAALALLPSGDAWPRDGSVLGRVMAGAGPTYERMSSVAAELLRDAPGGNLEFRLSPWESTVGLPDPCAGPAPTIAQRQQQVASRISARGGQSIPYFISVAAALGYQITVTEFARSTFGRRKFGMKFGGRAWAYTWRIGVPGVTARPFKFGQGRFGEKFRSWGNAVLECEMRRIAPAHTVLQFSYVGSSAAATWDVGSGWDSGGWAA